jgi:hypothetical protein
VLDLIDIGDEPPLSVPRPCCAPERQHACADGQQGGQRLSLTGGLERRHGGSAVERGCDGDLERGADRGGGGWCIGRPVSPIVNGAFRMVATGTESNQQAAFPL